MSEPYKTRMDSIVNNLILNCSLSMGYFEEPDMTGHKYGPDSDQIGDIIQVLDSHLGYLIEKLKENNIFNKTNIILVSGILFITIISTGILYTVYRTACTI